MFVSPASAYELLESFIKHVSFRQKTISYKTIFFKAKQITFSKKSYPKVLLNLKNLSNFGI